MLAATHDAGGDTAATWVDDMRWTTGDEKDLADLPRQHRLVVAHDPPAVAQRRSQARREQMREPSALGQQWGGRLAAQDAGQRRRGRPPSDWGGKARLCHAINDANLAHLITVGLDSELFRFSVDEQRLQHLEGLGGKPLLETNTDAPATEVVQRYKSPADIERRFRALKSARPRSGRCTTGCLGASWLTRAGVLLGVDPSPGAAHAAEGGQPSGVAGSATGAVAAHPASDGADWRRGVAARADQVGLPIHTALFAAIGLPLPMPVEVEPAIKAPGQISL